MKIYLVPTDFSKKSDNALYFTVELAKQEKSKIILLHVLHVEHITPDIIGLMITEDLKRVEQSTSEKLQNMCDAITKLNDVPCEFIYKTGDVVSIIHETIKNNKPNLVIMGTSGSRETRQQIKKNYTTKLIEQTTCPVLTVPSHFKYNGLRKITFATNYHANDVYALKLLVETAKPFRAQINSIHVTNSENIHDIEMARLKDFSDFASKHLEYHNLSFQLIQGEKVEKEIHKHADGTTTNLLALVKRKSKLTNTVSENKITKKMLYNSDVPFMVIPDYRNPPKKNSAIDKKEARLNRDDLN